MRSAIPRETGMDMRAPPLRSTRPTTEQLQRLLVLAKLSLAIVLAILLSACQTSSPATVATECRLFSPIRSSVRDTDDTRRQVVVHNRVGTASCGW